MEINSDAVVLVDVVHWHEDIIIIVCTIWLR